MVHGEPDYTVRGTMTSDETHIKGVEFMEPTISKCKPVSIENPAIAYDPATDRFKVDIEAMTIGTIPTDPIDRAARLLGIIYGDVGQLLQRPTTRDLLVQLRAAGVEIDPRNRLWTITEALNRNWTLTSSDIVDLYRKGTPTHFSITTSGTIVTPTSGKKLRLLGFMFSSNADIVTSLRWASGGSDMYPLQQKGVVGFNLIGLACEGDTDEVLYGYLSAAGTMKGTVFTEEFS